MALALIDSNVAFSHDDTVDSIFTLMSGSGLGSYPTAWCSLCALTIGPGVGRVCQAGMAGRLTRGLSLKGR
jgi:hypothetical protein